MNSTASAQQVIAELIGKKTYRPVLNLRMEEHPSNGGDGTPIVKGFSLYRKSLLIIPSGPYTLRFAVGGETQEYAVRVSHSTLEPDDEEAQAA